MTAAIPSELKRASYIRHTAALRDLVDRLRDHALLAVDTESNSLFAYHEQVCLVQLSTRERDYIIDPLAVDDMSPLGDLLADPAIEIVFHAAEYDVITLKRDFDFTFNTLFDTMLAARVCGWQKVGLGNILSEQFGVQAEKRFQRADWSKRPLPTKQLQYAQVDTHYLPALRDLLLAELIALNRWEEARETFTALSELLPAQHHFDPEGYWRIHHAKKLPREQMAIVRELYLLRDTIARRQNRPPFKVFGDQTLVALATAAPRQLNDLYDVKGLSSRLIRQDGKAILQAIAQGVRAKPPHPPQHAPRTPPDIQLRYDTLHAWRKQRAEARGVESDVIVPRTTLWALARQVPTTLEDLVDIPGLGDWRRAEYGAELIGVLARVGKKKKP